MRKLDILVPHWNETPEEMEPLLESIRIQQAVDLSQVGVIIAFDGPDATELPLGEWRSRYPFAIEDIHPEKGGVSHTRNAALDASTAEYVSFSDADDMYCDSCGLSIVFREMEMPPNERELLSLGIDPKDEEPGFELLVSNFREQTKDQETGKFIFVNHEMDSTFVHGKYMRRRFLIDNGIRWNDSLQVHEDSYFQILCRETAKPWRSRYCAQPFYMWKWRDNSVARHDRLYILKTFDSMISSSDALVDEFVRRMREDKAAAYAAFMILDAYYAMNKPEWLEVNHREYRDAVEKRFAEYYRKHRQKWESLTPQERALMSNVVRQRSVGEGMLMEAVTIGQWLERITEHVYDSRPKEDETVV